MKGLLALAITAGVIAGAACYQDDGPTGGGPQRASRVLLTDSPFPFDSVASVNVYVVRVQATRTFDTTGFIDWVTVAEPHKAFDLLSVQQGETTFVGSGDLPAGSYQAVRLVLNTDSSSIKWKSGGDAPVNWGYPGEISIYTLVESPVDVSTAGASIVLDFDVGRSFPYGFFSPNGFDFLPWVRAVDVNATGAIAGTVTTDVGVPGTPVKNANVTVYDMQSFANSQVVATGHTDAQGHYRVAFLRPSTYAVEIQQPTVPELAPVTTTMIGVTAGQTTPLSVVLPAAGSGSAYIQIVGPSSVGVGGTIGLLVSVGDSAGNPISHPPVTWSLGNPLDTAYVTLIDSIPGVMVYGKAAGTAHVVASSNGMSDTALVTVVGTAGTVFSVTVTPPTATLSVGDSAGFYATLRDSAGGVIDNRPVSWLSTDTTVLRIQGAFGPSVLVQPLKPGSVILRATSEGKIGQASVTVVP